MALPEVTINCDGSCVPNPGCGGYAATIEFCTREGNKVENVVSGCEPNSTNNRMELLAALRALEALKVPCKVYLCADSQYVIEGLSSWLKRWVDTGQVTQHGGSKKNHDLWWKLYGQTLRHNIIATYVAGHTGNEGNERVHTLANEARLKCKS